MTEKFLLSAIENSLSLFFIFLQWLYKNNKKASVQQLQTVIENWETNWDVLLKLLLFFIYLLGFFTWIISLTCLRCTIGVLITPQIILQYSCNTRYTVGENRAPQEEQMAVTTPHSLTPSIRESGWCWGCLKPQKYESINSLEISHGNIFWTITLYSQH